MLGKGQRALQMYLPNNPVYQRTLQQVTEAFAPVWRVSERIVLDIQEEQIVWEDVPVLRQANRNEGNGVATVQRRDFGSSRWCLASRPKRSSGFFASSIAPGCCRPMPPMTC